MIRLSDSEFSQIAAYMRENYGINLNKKKILIECRLARELEKRGLTSYKEYLLLMEQDRSGKMAGEMVSRLTTNYTYFFRESEHFTILTEKIFPRMFEKNSHPVWNFWCAGCSTGEECYTLAMAAREYQEKNSGCPDIRILGTDVSESVLEAARKCEYPVKELEEIPSAWKSRYCHISQTGTFGMDESLRQMVRFRHQNLLEPVSQREKFSLILCRNVMIYFDRPSREKVVKNLENSLAPGGYLFTGHAELLSQGETGLNNLYPAVYQKREAER